MTSADLRMMFLRSPAGSGPAKPRAETAGDPEPARRASQGQLALRNREILHERESGSSLEELARKHGLQRATVKALLIRERHRRAFENPQLAGAG